LIGRFAGPHILDVEDRPLPKFPPLPPLPPAPDEASGVVLTDIDVPFSRLLVFVAKLTGASLVVGLGVGLVGGWLWHLASR
jgi:hypothetical protein